MKTKRDTSLLFFCMALVFCVVVFFPTRSIRGSDKSYEIRPEISLPEHRTDTARAIDAYERVMDRLISLMERNQAETREISKKLILIDYRLSELSAKVSRIEKALGIEQSVKRIEKPVKVETSPVSITNESGSQDKK